MYRRRSKSEVDKIIIQNLSSYLTPFVYQNVRKGIKKRKCVCGCGLFFEPHGKYHMFYNRSHYQRFHRMPGVVKRIIDHKD